MRQGLDVKRQCAGRDPEAVGDLTGCQALRTGLYEQAEHVEPTVLREGGKGTDGAFGVHVSRIIEIKSRVKSRRPQLTCIKVYRAHRPIIGPVLPRNRSFIAAALLWALLGGLLGVAWLGWPGRLPALALRAHAHLMLVGFVGMMIFGIALHVLPRFTGRALLSERLGDASFALANLGLPVMVLGWLSGSTAAARFGGALLWAALLAFAANVIGTVRPWARR